MLIECLDDPDIERVVTVGRRPVQLEHAHADTLEQIEHADFSDFSALADALSGLDACSWCLGIASAGMSEEDYRRVTVDFTLAAPDALHVDNPELTFCFTSGAGSNRDGRAMWARVRSEAEDRLAKAGFAACYDFRPAMIRPMRGACQAFAATGSCTRVEPTVPTARALAQHGHEHARGRSRDDHRHALGRPQRPPSTTRTSTPWPAA